MEWATSDILCEKSTSEDGGTHYAAVGELDAKRAVLKQHLEGMSDMDIDPDRVEVCLIYKFLSTTFPFLLLPVVHTVFPYICMYDCSDLVPV